MKNLWNVGLRAGNNNEGQDFYEPRITGRMFKRPGNTRFGFYANTNAAKKYAASIDYGYTVTNKYDGRRNELYLSNQYRFNDKLTLGVSSYNASSANEVGFAFIQTDSVHFGLRKRTTVENIFTAKYNFNIKMGISVRVRHYWSKVAYNNFYLLKEDGYLQPEGPVSRNPGRNENYFNVDMVYTWQFALGSFINIGWKDFSSLANQQTNYRYYSNLGKTLNAAQQNNFSIKVIYFLDYLTLQKKK